ncbi:type II secretion system F family protein [Salinicoccus roseus]|uniref:Type II secretion system F family protein n=1 Tax=Salinicoccus roseus TaxID=45670 RepID=A0A0C2DKR3_9STAP|nr:type II secretion system F family protein [Salinicoccus roseus]KIH70623.1 type II secretion system protein [Salinicoccus roseus]MDB0580724.1 type II secretion system F family protein [Salinicoccus roseus]
MEIILITGTFITFFLLFLAISAARNPEGTQSRESFSIKGSLKNANSTLKRLLVKRGRKSRKRERLENELIAAGILMKVEEFIAFRMMAFFIAGAVLYMISNNFLLAIMGGVLGYFIPMIMLEQKKKKRIRQFNESLPSMITSISGSLRAGFSLLQALQMVEEESYSPVKEEVQYVLKTLQYGTRLEDALLDWKRRMPSAELDMLVESIMIQRQVGGNLVYLLDKILETIRERTKIENQVRTLTAQGKLSGLIIGLLPIVVGVLLYIINPDYMSLLFTEPIGRILLAGALVSEVIGFIFIRKMTTIEV